MVLEGAVLVEHEGVAGGDRGHHKSGLQLVRCEHILIRGIPAGLGGLRRMRDIELSSIAESALR